jgi:hypothetical protein
VTQYPNIFYSLNFFSTFQTAWPPLSFMIRIDERKASLGSDGNFKGKSTTTKALSIALTTEDVVYHLV